MRNILLSLVVVAVLIAGAVGGTLAGFSDSETALDNYIETGSLDLKVNGTDDAPWGAGINGAIAIKNMMPCKTYWSDPLEVRNDGQGDNPSGSPEPTFLYIHVKDACCSNSPPIHPGPTPSDYPNGEKPEPELVAEFGGKVNCTIVPGLGVQGDSCNLLDFIEVTVYFDGVPLVGPVPMSAIVDDQLFIGELPPCGDPHEVQLAFHMLQISETEAVELGWLEAPLFQPGSKFSDWPTNALMCDRTTFNLEFDLLQHPTQNPLVLVEKDQQTWEIVVGAYGQLMYQLNYCSGEFECQMVVADLDPNTWYLLTLMGEWPEGTDLSPTDTQLGSVGYYGHDPKTTATLGWADIALFQTDAGGNANIAVPYTCPVNDPVWGALTAAGAALPDGTYTGVRAVVKSVGAGAAPDWGQVSAGGTPKLFEFAPMDTFTIAPCPY
jgi:predicted ribosomally synthesized peptide with SipW-like signal peptide